MTSRARTGFSLIEIAIVIGIVGILTAGAMRVFTTYSERAQERATGDRIDEVREALVLYVARTGKLPCPADAVPATAADAGLAQATGNGSCASGDEMVGVPWRTLGIAQEATFDGWGWRITYAVDPDLTADDALDMTSLGSSASGGGGSGGSGGSGNGSNNANGASSGGGGGNITLTNPTGDPSDDEGSGGAVSVQSVADWLDGKGLIVRTRHNDSSTNFQDPNDGTGAAFVLISHGVNGNGAFAREAAVPDDGSAGPNEVENADGDNVFVDRQRSSSNASTPFDDVVISLTVDTVAKKAGLHSTD